MSDIPTRFQSLPNEILRMIFEYIYARDLYRSFYRLNARFDAILQSLDHFHLLIVFRRYQQDRYDQLFASRVDTITINRNRALKNVEQLINVRKLIILKTSPKKIIGMIEPFSSIEFLTIQSKTNIPLDDLFRRICSNEFPNLKSCVLGKLQPIESIDQGLIAPKIRSLTIHSNNPLILPSLLMACPNLYSLNLSILTLSPSASYEQVHERLQCLTLSTNRLKKKVFDVLFQHVPNLKRLVSNSKEMNRIDWEKIPLDRLKYLQRFEIVCDKQD